MNSDSTYYLTKTQIEEGIKHCFNKSCLIIDACMTLRKNYSYPGVVVGLVTFALEELGKGLLLQDRLKKSKKKYGIPYYIFGRGKSTKGHYDKISRALQELPEDSKRFYPSILIKLNSDIKTKRVKIGPQETITIPAGLTGLFISEIDPEDVITTHSDDELNLETDSIADFTTRMLCFYVDWDDSKKRWKTGVPISKKLLDNLICQIKIKIDSIHECEM